MLNIITAQWFKSAAIGSKNDLLWYKLSVITMKIDESKKVNSREINGGYLN